MPKPLFKKLIQVGMVVSNLKRSMYKYVYNYGIGPMYVLKFDSDNVSDMFIYGKRKNYSMNVGVCPIGDIRFELIEPLSDSIYSEFLKKNGEGVIHHLKLDVDDYDKTLGYLNSIKIRSIQSGYQLGDRGVNIYNYLDTSDQLGFICEIVNISKDFIKPKPDSWFPEVKKYKPIFKKPTSIGIVVSNLSKKINEYSRLFNINKWYLKEIDSSNVEDMHIHGKRMDYSIKLAISNFENIKIQLIEPTSYSIFSEFYEKYGEGIIHHLGMKVDNYDYVLKNLKSKGLEILHRF
ncbi:MAG: VOC family protein, partial [Actinobacteria bacterium]|nr:VOC family protein [Actinomycetota bacterium]